MNDRAARLATVLSLVWFVPGVAVVSVHMLNILWPGWGTATPADRVNYCLLTATLFMVIPTIWTWRKYVRWTALRSMSTGALTGMVLSQVLVALPWFPVTGCAQRELLLTQQAVACGGLWCMLCGIIWWNVQLAGRDIYLGSRQRWREVRTMSRDAARLAIAFGMVPLLVGVYFLSQYFWVMAGMPRLGMQPSILSAELCSIILGAVWLILWRRSVQWTALRIRLTAYLGVVLICAPLGVILIPQVTSGDPLMNIITMVLVCSPLFAHGLWIAGTAWIWRHSGNQILRTAPVESHDLERTLTCPTCNYPLVGLREAHCPECGWSSTLDDVVRRSLAKLAEAESV